MVDNPAHVILTLITTVASTVWLISAKYLANSPKLASRQNLNESGMVPSDLDFVSGPTTIVGRCEVVGEPSETSRQLAVVLASVGLWPGGPLEITDRRENEVSFVTPGDSDRPQGHFKFHKSDMGKSCVDFQVQYRGLVLYLKIAWLVQILAIIVLAVGFWLLRTYVATSSQPAVWGQSFQLIQIVHFLWPPFLLGYQYRSQYRLVHRQIETMLKNLPHSEA